MTTLALSIHFRYYHYPPLLFKLSIRVRSVAPDSSLPSVHIPSSSATIPLSATDPDRFRNHHSDSADALPSSFDSVGAGGEVGLVGLDNTGNVLVGGVRKMHKGRLSSRHWGRQILLYWLAGYTSSKGLNWVASVEGQAELLSFSSDHVLADSAALRGMSSKSSSVKLLTWSLLSQQGLNTYLGRGILSRDFWPKFLMILTHSGPSFICWSIFVYGFDFVLMLACSKNKKTPRCHWK